MLPFGYADSILSSSVVEQSAVNRLAVGSSPTWGVFITKKLYEKKYGSIGYRRKTI